MINATQIETSGLCHIIGDFIIYQRVLLTFDFASLQMTKMLTKQMD